MTAEALQENVFLNLGSGGSALSRLPKFFSEWRQIRVDVDPETKPDLVASMTDLSAISDQAVQGVWASHCLEHLFHHEVGVCLREVRRVMTDRGFLCLRVPDLQTVAAVVAEDRLHEVLYESASGPVSAHDVIYGFGSDVSKGRLAMAHKTGFTPRGLTEVLGLVFESYLVRRTQKLELVAVARKGRWSSDEEPSDLLLALGL